MVKVCVGWPLVAAQGSLAQSREQAAAFQAFIWLGILVIALMLGAAIVSYIRRKTRASARTPPPVFALEDLRQLRDHGDLTDTEYETLRQRLLDGSGAGEV